MPTNTEADEAMYAMAEQIAEKLQLNLLNKIHEPLNAMTAFIIAQLMEELAEEINSKHFPAEFSKADFRRAAGRALRKLADEIQGHK